MKASLSLLLLQIAMAAATVVTQKTENHLHHHSQLTQSNFGDSFFAKPVEGYPDDSNLALTHSFIFEQKLSGATKHSLTKGVKLGSFEVDLLWIYVLGALIIIGVVVAIVICCCAGDGVEKEKGNNMMQKEKEQNKDEMQKMMGDMEAQGNNMD